MKVVTYIDTEETRLWNGQKKYLYEWNNCSVLKNALTSFGPIQIIHEIKPIQAVQYLQVILF